MREYIFIIGFMTSLIAYNVGTVELKLVGIYHNVHQDMITSPNEKYSISVDWDMVGIGVLKPNKVYFKREGNYLWSKEDLPYISYFISDNGSLVGHVPWDEAGSKGELGFIDQTGSVIRKISVEYFTGGCFSPDGSLFGAQTIHGVLIFDSNGQEVWRLGKARKFNISHKGERIVTLFDNLIQFYWYDSLICEREMETHFIKELLLSSNGDRVAVISKRCAWIFGTQQGDLIWRGEVTPSESYISIGKLNKGFCFLIGKYEKVGEQMLGKGRIEVVKEGVIIGQTEIDWGEGIPRFYLRDNMLLVRTRDKEWEFKIIE